MLANDEEKKAIEDDLKAAAALDATATTEGGKILVESLIKDVISGVERLCNAYSTLTQQEFVAISADMKSKLDLARTLTRAKANKDYLVDLLQQPLQH